MWDTLDQNYCKIRLRNYVKLQHFKNILWCNKRTLVFEEGRKESCSLQEIWLLFMT